MDNTHTENEGNFFFCFALLLGNHKIKRKKKYEKVYLNCISQCKVFSIPLLN